MVLSSPELTIQEGDTALLDCVLPNSMKKQVTKVDWMFSAGEHAKEEFVLYYFANLSVPLGPFEDRVRLVGKISDYNGSILLQDVRETDQGIYTCEIQVHEESNVFKKRTLLRVVPVKHQTLGPKEDFRIDVMGNYQHVIIVAIVCITIILLAILGVIMRRSHRQHRSENHLENTRKTRPEAHIYSTATMVSVTEEEEPSRESEATYMTMLPVWPSWRAEPNKSSEIMVEREHS